MVSMNMESYPVEVDECHNIYRFCSYGPKGAIEKIIKYELVSCDIFNLSFGDYDVMLNKVDDKRVSNNLDTLRVLVTVAKTLYDFTQRFPDSSIFVTGSTAARTRLYQRMLGAYQYLFQHDFNILGLKGVEWIPFQKNTHFTAFIAIKK